MAKIEIVRSEIVDVVSTGENSYHDLTFKDKEGKEYKVGSKRKSYFTDKIISGKTVKLNYSVYNNNEYIYSAEAIEDEKVTPAPAPVETHPTPKIDTSRGIADTRDNRNKSYALSYAKDLCVVGIIQKDEVLPWAKTFEDYLNGILVVQDVILSRKH